MEYKELEKQNERLKATIKAFEKYLPKRIVEKITTNPYNIRVEGERRFVSILFGDVSGFTALSEKLDPEDVIKVINKYFNKMLFIVEKYGGDVDKFVGDAIMVVFGAPVAHKDDPERAVRAALEMQEAIESIEPVKAGDIYVKVRMSIGINTGEIVALNMGTDDRMEYTVMGDNVNLSARLEAFANATEVIISDRTYKYVKDVFNIDVLEPIMVKGKTEPIPVYKVLSVKERKAKDNEYPIVGYDVELKELENCISNYLEGRPFSIHICGEQGTGKTRLADFLHEQIDRKNLDIWEFRGEAFAQSAPMHVLKRAVEHKLQITGSDSKEIIKSKIDNALSEAERMGLYLLFDIIEPDSMKEEQMVKIILLSLGGMLLNITSKNKPVLVFNDIHYYDSMSMRIIDGLIKSSNEEKIAVAGFSREENDLFSKTIRAHMPDTVAMTALISEILQQEPSTGLTELIYDKANGNPLFTIELLKLLFEKNAIQTVNGKACVDPKIEVIVPDSLKSVFLEKIDNVPEEFKTLMQYSSIIGSTFDKNLLCSVFKYSTAQAEDILKVLDQSGYIQFSGGNNYIFSSELFHEAVYNSLMKNKRKEYHNIAASYIESNVKGDMLSDTIRTIAYHFDKAENELKAPLYLEKTADSEMKYFSYENALKNYEKAVMYRQRGDNRDIINTLILKIILIYSITGRRELALKKLTEREVQFAVKPEFKSKYYNHLGILKEKLGDLKGAMHAYAKSLEAAMESGNDELIAQTNNQLGVSSIVAGEYDKALQYFNKAIDLNIRLNKMNDLSRQYVNSGRVYMHMGDNQSAVKYFNMALEIQNKYDIKGAKLITLINLGFLYDNEGNYKKAEDTYNEAMLIAEMTANSNEQARIMNNLANIYINTGRVDKALEIFKKIGNIYENIGDKKGTAEVFTNIGEIDMMLGNFDEAKTYFQDAIELCNETGHTHLLIYARIQFANALVFLGYLAQADELLTKSMMEGERLNIPDFIIMAKHVLARLKGLSGDLEEEENLLNQSLKLAEDIGNPEFSANINTTMVKTLAERGEFEKALELTGSILEYARKNNNEILQSDIMASIADIYLRTDNGSRLSEIAEESFIIADKTRSKLSLLRNLLVISRYYLANQDYTSAEDSVKQAEEIANETGSIEHKIIVYRIMKELFGRMSNIQRKNDAMLKCLNTIEDYIDKAGSAYMEQLLAQRNLRSDIAEYIISLFDQFDTTYIREHLRDHNTFAVNSAIDYIKENKLLPAALTDKIL